MMEIMEMEMMEMGTMTTRSSAVGYCESCHQWLPKNEIKSLKPSDGRGETWRWHVCAKCASAPKGEFYQHLIRRLSDRICKLRDAGTWFDKDD